MAVARARVANASIRTVQDSGQRKRWRWLGHVWRMPPFALSKTAVRESDGGGQGTCGECLHSHCPRQRSGKAMAVARARVAIVSCRPDRRPERRHQCNAKLINRRKAYRLMAFSA